MEVTQFTYFQQVGGIDLQADHRRKSPTASNALAMYLQGVDNVLDQSGPTRGLKLRRRLPPERSGASPPTTSSTSDVEFSAQRPSLPTKASSRSLMEHRLALPGLRAGAEGRAHLQPAGCPRRDLRDRACRLTSAASATWRAAVAQSYFDSRERLGFPMAPREWVKADGIRSARKPA